MGNRLDALKAEADEALRVYPDLHRHPVNVVIHLIAVPLFVFAHLLVLIGLFSPNIFLLLIGVVLAGAALLAQYFGHSHERDEPPPYAGTLDRIKRLYIEQFYNFWRYLAAGTWRDTLKG